MSSWLLTPAISTNIKPPVKGNAELEITNAQAEQRGFIMKIREAYEAIHPTHTVWETEGAEISGDQVIIRMENVERVLEMCRGTLIEYEYTGEDRVLSSILEDGKAIWVHPALR